MTDSITRNLVKTFAQLGKETEDELNEFIETQAFALTLFQQEAARLSQNLGHDHPRVRVLKNNIDDNMAILHGLKEARDVSTTAPPEVPDKGAIVYGRATTRSGIGIPGLIVYGEDINKKPIRDMGYTETDKLGRFSLTLEAEAVTKLLRTKIFLSLQTKDKKTLFRDTDPFHLSPGSQLLRTIRVETNIFEPEGPTRPEPIDISKLQGIGPVYAQKLRAAGIHDVQTFLKTDERKLKRIMGGANIRELKARARKLLERR